MPHRKDYYFFFLVKKGNHHHWVDFVHHEVQPGFIYFTQPHQVHLKEKNPPVDGTLLAFSDEFLATDEQTAWKKLPILRNPADWHSLKLEEQDINFLTNLFTPMLGEYGQPQDWTKGVLQSYLKIFLVYLSRLYTRQFNQSALPADGQSLVKRMKELIGEHYDSIHQVSGYAHLLNVTPGQLNDTVRANTDRTASDLIQERIILEAKKALFHAALNVQEIAYSLGFDDPAYFNRFFKRRTGETPVRFRNNMRENQHP
ncbi:helix-turn-helix domain-containing protein [Flavitalea flava]